jgi:hypothetical protein
MGGEYKKAEIHRYRNSCRPSSHHSYLDYPGFFPEDRNISGHLDPPDNAHRIYSQFAVTKLRKETTSFQYPAMNSATISQRFTALHLYL